MGRMIEGDIVHKLAFALQSSVAAQRFGGSMRMLDWNREPVAPALVDYFFNTTDLDSIEIELAKIEQLPGFSKAKEFYLSGGNYLDDSLLEEAGVGRNLLRDVSDWVLGCKIRDCVKQKSICQFEAEL